MTYFHIDLNTRAILGLVSMDSIPDIVPPNYVEATPNQLSVFNSSQNSLLTLNQNGTITSTPLSTTVVRSDSFILPDNVIQTTNNTQTEIARFTLDPSTMYVAKFQLRGVDLANGNRRYIEATAVVARISGGAVIDNITTIINSFNNATSQGWAANVILDTTSIPAKPNDVVIVVTGQVGRTIEWVLSTQVERIH